LSVYSYLLSSSEKTYFFLRITFFAYFFKLLWDFWVGSSNLLLKYRIEKIPFFERSLIKKLTDP